MSPTPARLLTIITPPTQPGEHCGLSDHAACLATELSRGGWQVTIATPATLKQGPSTPLLLQFTPLSYSRIGLPLPLLIDLLIWRWLGRGRGHAVLVFFHEVPFLNRSGWKGRLVMPLQCLLCMLLAAVATDVLINQPAAITWLGVLRFRRAPQFLPCWSNVGEAPAAPAPLDRPLVVAVFGSWGKRRHAHQLVDALGGYRLLFGDDVRVLDIGEPGPLPAALRGEVTVTGSQPEAEVHRLLLGARFGWFYAEPDQVCKSGVFAAYCALGVVPILAFPGARPADQYLAPAELPLQTITTERLQTLWQQGRAWLEHHSLARGTARIEQLLQPC